VRERERERERERDSFASRLIAVPRCSHSLLDFSLRNATAACIHPFTSHIPFLLSFPFRSILRVRKSFIQGREGKEGLLRIRAVKQCHITPNNSALVWIIYKDCHCIAITFVTWYCQGWCTTLLVEKFLVRLLSNCYCQRVCDIGLISI